MNGDYRVLNYLLSPIGIEGPNWLVDLVWALLAAILVSAFGVGIMMLIFHTNIRSIPINSYEATSLDGASSVRQFSSVALPIITSTTPSNLIIPLTSAFQQLTLVVLLTNDGPLKSTYFYGMFTYNNAFKHHRLGYASVNTWVMFIIIPFLTVIVFKPPSAWVFYETEVKNGKAENKKKGGKIL